MKRILLFAYLCLFLVLACSGGLNIASTPSFAPSPTPCVQTGVLRIVRVQQVMVDFYCGVTAAQQALIVEFVGHALDAVLPGVASEAEVFSFIDLDQGVKAEYGLMKAEGYRPSLEALRTAWLEKGLLGQAFKGAVFLHVGDPVWDGESLALPSITILHEMHHVLQYQLIDSRRRAPVWLLEGGADDFAALEMADLDLAAPSRSGASSHCEYRLLELEYERDDVPLACTYVEGARAVQLLLDEYGRQAYYQLLRNIGANSSFDRGFLQTYGFGVSDFYQRFDAYLRSGYTVHPRFPLPSLTPSVQP